MSRENTFTTILGARGDARRHLSPGSVARVLRLSSGRYTWAVAEIVENYGAWPMEWAGAVVVPHVTITAEGDDGPPRGSVWFNLPERGTLIVHVANPDDAEGILDGLRALDDREGSRRWLVLVGDLRATHEEQLVDAVRAMLDAGEPLLSAEEIVRAVLGAIKNYPTTPDTGA